MPAAVRRPLFWVSQRKRRKPPKLVYGAAVERKLEAARNYSAVINTPADGATMSSYPSGARTTA